MSIVLPTLHRFPETRAVFSEMSLEFLELYRTRIFLCKQSLICLVTSLFCGILVQVYFEWIIVMWIWLIKRCILQCSAERKCLINCYQCVLCCETLFTYLGQHAILFKEREPLPDQERISSIKISGKYCLPNDGGQS